MNKKNAEEKHVVIVGAGPAGLTAAYQLGGHGIRSTVLEKDSVVGGISKTARYKGFHFDIGGHRFFTKVAAVEKLWFEILGDDLLHRQRMSRIYFNNKFFHYPLRPANALLGLGLGNSFLYLLSYLRSCLFPIQDEKTFEDWVSNRFGRRMYQTFFKTYTEKVWGMPCDQISADWAAQRIKGLSLVTALKSALLKKADPDRKRVIKTLIDSFYYPKYGPGMMWERVASLITNGSSSLHLKSTVETIRWSGNRIEAVEVSKGSSRERIDGTEFISSMPIRELFQKLEPRPPKLYLEAAEQLSYRDFLTVTLVIDGADLFPDNWIYIHDPTVRVGRVQNFNNWSPYLVPDTSKTCLGLEYFCFEGDDLWSMSDKDLVELGKHELGKLELIPGRKIIDGTVVRMPKAYPVYDDNYKQALTKIREFLKRINNLQLVGRNGMHKYNNQDHSMMTAMLAVENIMGANFDLWSVNVDDEYQEEIARDQRERHPGLTVLESTQPLVPVSVAVDDLLAQAFARTDKLALASAVGIVCGLYVCLGTLFLMATGDVAIDGKAMLLGQYFYGHAVSYKGALIGGFYGLFWGFISGWLVAYVRNTVLGFYLFYVKKRAEKAILQNFLNYI